MSAGLTPGWEGGESVISSRPVAENGKNELSHRGLPRGGLEPEQQTVQNVIIPRFCQQQMDFPSHSGYLKETSLLSQVGRGL